MTQDPDTGASSSVYDNDGNVVASTDAMQQSVASGFDALNRKTATSVEDGATGVWLMNESAGPLAADSSGRTQTGSPTTSAISNATVSGTGVTWSASDRPGGGAATFNGTGGQIATAGPVLNTTQSFTVSAWVKLASLPSGV